MKSPIKSKLFGFVLIVGLLVVIYQIFISLFFYCSNAYVDTTMVNISSQVSGQIQSLNIQNNQQVKQGQLLFEIDPIPFTHKLQQETLNLSAAKQQYKVLKAEQNTVLTQVKAARSLAHLASITADRYGDLYKQHVVSAQALDDVTTSKQVKTDAILVLQAQFNQLQTNLDLQQVAIHNASVAVAQAQYELSLTKITAPVSGTINNFSNNLGDSVTAYQPLFGIRPANISENTWYVTANYAEKYMSRIKPGQYAVMYLNSNPWELFIGRVGSKGTAVARDQVETKNALPYIQPAVSWISYPYLFPVKIYFHSKHLPELYRGADVNLFIIR